LFCQASGKPAARIELFGTQTIVSVPVRPRGLPQWPDCPIATQVRALTG
jgi:hypothetical protein